MINLKEIKPRHHLQLLKTFPKTTPKQSRRRTYLSIFQKILFREKNYQFDYFCIYCVYVYIATLPDEASNSRVSPLCVNLNPREPKFPCTNFHRAYCQ